jgi:hypothetical protein
MVHLKTLNPKKTHPKPETLTWVLDSKCSIRLGNLEFRKISKDFRFLKKPPLFSYELEVFFWEAQRVFFLTLVFLCKCKVIFALWSPCNEKESCFYSRSICYVANVIELFITIYLFFLKRKF